MEDDQIQTPISSSNYSNGGPTPSKMGPGPPVGFPNEGDMVVMGGNNRLRQWPHSSRIIRVSRASGGKDRHSKVWTAKGPRDRRVRLSVSTAIQFYDLQDRLGYDQPSKAVEWLIKAASDAIHELPSLNSMNFPPETPRQSSGEPRGGGGLLGDVEMDGQNQMGGCVSKSGCSSNNSENSKGSGLSLSRSEIRVKARERARERTAKEKEKEPEPPAAQCQQQLGRRVDVNANNQEQQNVDLVAPTSSFTQLLTAGINNLKYENNGGGGGGGNANTSASPRGANSQWLSSTSATVTPMDYFGGGGGILSPNPTRVNHLTSGYQTGPIHVGSGVTLAQIMTLNHHNQHNQNTSHENQLHHHNHHQHQQHYPYVGDNQQMYQASGSGGSDYNLSFSISSSTSASSGGHIGAGYNNNRGPLQSNSASAQTLLPYLPRYATTTDGSNVPFFLGGAAVENQHHQHFHPTGLQLCYGDSNQHSDQKGKGKN